MKLRLLLAFVCAASRLLAQPAPPPNPVPTGQVSGHVTCSDTNQPARFASVQLIPQKPEQVSLSDFDPMQKNPDFAKAVGVLMGSLMKGSNLSTLTGIDGSFLIAKVPPGTYYVVAQMPGYLSAFNQFSQVERLTASPATVKALESAAEKLTVDANHAAHLELRVERGAAISGNIRYDDGSPAASVVPVLLALQPDNSFKPLSLSLQPAPSDDRGRFRIAGLAPGKYAIQAALPTVQASAGLGTGSIGMHMNMGDALIVYSSGAMRQNDIKPVQVAIGDDVDGVDILFPLNGLHTIAGTVVAKADNHPVNRGTVVLIDPTTKTMLRTAFLDADGTFRFNYVPEGSYLLRVAGAADTETTPGTEAIESDFARLMNAKPIKSYADAEQTITVKTDMTTITLQVPEPPKAIPAP